MQLRFFIMSGKELQFTYFQCVIHFGQKSICAKFLTNFRSEIMINRRTRSWSYSRPQKPNQYIPMAISPTKSLFFFKSKNSSPSEATLCNLSNPEKVHPKFEEEGQLKSQQEFVDRAESSLGLHHMSSSNSERSNVRETYI